VHAVHDRIHARDGSPQRAREHRSIVAKVDRHARARTARQPAVQGVLVPCHGAILRLGRRFQPCLRVLGGAVLRIGPREQPAQHGESARACLHERCGVFRTEPAEPPHRNAR
ncbi:MAG: hypothetical protein ACK56I_34120, partial [bacterium]